MIAINVIPTTVFARPILIRREVSHKMVSSKIITNLIETQLPRILLVNYSKFQNNTSQNKICIVNHIRTLNTFDTLLTNAGLICKNDNLVALSVEALQFARHFGEDNLPVVVVFSKHLAGLRQDEGAVHVIAGNL